MRGMAGQPRRKMCGIGAVLLLLAAPMAAAQTPRVPAPESGIGVQVVARLDAVIGAPMAGRLREFPLRDGDRFQSGDVLARFACAQVDAFKFDGYRLSGSNFCFGKLHRIFL